MNEPMKQGIDLRSTILYFDQQNIESISLLQLTSFFFFKAKRVKKRKNPSMARIAGFQCHAIQNENQNRSID